MSIQPESRHQALQLSDEQLAQYQRDGAILLKGVLSEEEQALLEQGMEECRRHPGKRSTRASSPTGEGETFMETFPSLNSPSLKKLLALGRIPEIAARMMQVPSAQLVLGQLFYKEKGCIIPTPWHQDTPFLRLRGDDMIRVWVTADYSPRQLSLQVVRGSHRWNVVYDPRPPGDRNGNIKETEGRMIQIATGSGPPVPDIAKYPDSFDILNWDVEPGDALVFNGNMLHAAGGMEDYPGQRRAYTSMWGGPKLRYIAPPDNALPTLAEINKITVPHNVCIGDYPDAFPIGWQQSRAGPA